MLAWQAKAVEVASQNGRPDVNGWDGPEVYCYQSLTLQSRCLFGPTPEQKGAIGATEPE
jgi:hypothetical protein